MVKGKLGKLKCILRRWQSSPSSRIAVGSAEGLPEPDSRNLSSHRDTWQNSRSFNGDEVPSGYQPVYVGKSRRRYLVRESLLGHPLFQNLLESSSPAAVGCEVVLFEHLLWMLENVDPKPESLDDLLEFYA